MGFACDLRFAFRMQYRVSVDNSMVEHELDHVFVGRFNGLPAPAPSEVEQVEWVSSVGLSYLVGVDGFSIWLIVLTAFMVPLAIVASSMSMMGMPSRTGYSSRQ